MSTKSNESSSILDDEIKSILKQTKKLSDASYERIFSRNPKNEDGMYTYNCILCSVANLPGENALYIHIAGKKHQHYINSKYVPHAVSFRKRMICYDSVLVTSSPCITESGLAAYKSRTLQEHLDDSSSDENSHYKYRDTAIKQSIKPSKNPIMNDPSTSLASTSTDPRFLSTNTSIEKYSEKLAYEINLIELKYKWYENTPELLALKAAEFRRKESEIRLKMGISDEIIKEVASDSNKDCLPSHSPPNDQKDEVKIQTSGVIDDAAFINSPTINELCAFLRSKYFIGTFVNMAVVLEIIQYRHQGAKMEKLEEKSSFQLFKNVKFTQFLTKVEDILKTAIRDRLRQQSEDRLNAARIALRKIRMLNNEAILLMHFPCD